MASRPRTLPLSLSGILIGAALVLPGHFDGLTFALCLWLTLLFQIVSNLANDLGDGLKGTDNEGRIGPARAFQSGLLSAEELHRAIRLLSAVSMLSALFLVFYAFGREQWQWIAIFSALAVLSIWAGRRYTMGDSPYGYHGWGDLAVFLFFGLLAVLGTQYVMSGELGAYSVLPAVSTGLLSTAVLNLNNMRDVRNDDLQGKRTMVVRMGLPRARIYHACLILGSLVIWVAYLLFTDSPWFFYGLLWPYGIILVHLNRVFHVRDERNFDPELKKVALSTFLISLTFLIINSAFS